MTCLYAFGSTTPGSRRRAVPLPEVTGATTMPARFIASGVRVMDASRRGPLTPSSVTVGAAALLDVAVAEGPGPIVADAGRMATNASPAPSASNTSAPPITNGQRSVTCDVGFIEPLLAQFSTPAELRTLHSTHR